MMEFDGFLEVPIKVNMKLESSLIMGNEREFSHAILVILSNAKDILIDQKIQNPIISILLTNNKNDFELSIEDNGGGIQSEDIKKIFDPYFSTKQHKKGFGLGLYITKMIIEKGMNGRISAMNTHGGAKFIIKVFK